MERLPLETQTVYAELLEQLFAIEAQPSLGRSASTCSHPGATRAQDRRAIVLDGSAVLDLPLAWGAWVGRGRRWSAAARAGMAALRRKDAPLARRLSTVVAG